MQDVVAAFILHSDASACAARFFASVFPSVEVHKEDLCIFEVSRREGTVENTKVKKRSRPVLSRNI